MGLKLLTNEKFMGKNIKLGNNEKGRREGRVSGCYIPFILS